MFNFIAEEFNGAIDITETDSIILEDNFVAGAQRMGINYRGEFCPGGAVMPSGFNHSIQRNTVYGALSGVTVLPILPVYASPKFYLSYCIKIAG